MKARARGALVPALPGLLAFVIGVALLVSPWWSTTLPASEYPLVIVLGAVFASIGAFAALPDRWPRARQLAFTTFMAMFGNIATAEMKRIRAAAGFMDLSPGADGRIPS